MVRVLVTGSRDLADPDTVHDVLSELFHEHADEPEFVVIHGGARGADRFARDWARLMARYGVKEEVHHADWHRFGKGAGPIRNQEMIDSKPDICLAFFKIGAANYGTKNCVEKARVANIGVIEYIEP